MIQDTPGPFQFPTLNLYMLLLGCRPPGRNTEQHDIFFGIGENLRDLVPVIKKSWPETKGNIHIDAWRPVNFVDGYHIAVTKATNSTVTVEKSPDLFFINLGGYKQNEFEEFHYKMVIAAGDKAEAVDKAKKTAFFRHTGFKGATAHIDDKYGVDVDDIYEIADILPVGIKEKYSIMVTPADSLAEDEMNLGYFKLSMFQ